MLMAIRVVLADDHNVVRKGIREFLGEEPDLEVVGEARNGQEAVDLALALQPDVVVMDIAMPSCPALRPPARFGRRPPRCGCSC
jgi:DNA-binding NarL/FixJ family response regulator